MDEYDSTEAALGEIDRYDAVIVRVASLDADVIARGDRLKVIAKHGAGLDNVDTEAKSNRGIVVCNTPGANARSVAEHAVALLLAVRRNLRTADRHVRSGGIGVRSPATNSPAIRSDCSASGPSQGKRRTSQTGWDRQSSSTTRTSWTTTCHPGSGE
ncbi:Rossmann-fold NAD(P)-binding domain-containing protein [Haloplanus aerogenes]|uniref:hypothetical protein n=1 Tax=Haloplanus aerogenes TaxID=660522 RepID=UPI001AA01D82